MASIPADGFAANAPPVQAMQSGDTVEAKKQAKADAKSRETADGTLEAIKDIGSQTIDFLKQMFNTQDSQALPPNVWQFQNKIIKSTFKNVVQNKYFENSLKVLGNLARNIGKGLVDMVLGVLMFAIFDPSGELLGSLIEMLAGLVVFLIGALANIIPRVIPIILRIIPILIRSLKMIITEIVKLLPVIIDAIIDLIPVLWDAIKEIAPVILSGLIQIVTTIFDRLAQHFPWLNDALSMLKQIGTTAMGFFNTVSEFFQSIWAAVLPEINEFVKVIKEDLLPGLQTIWEIFQPILSVIFDIYSWIYGKIFSVIWEVIKAIGTIVGGILYVSYLIIKNVILGFMKAIGFIGKAIKVINNAWRQLFRWLGDVLTSAWNRFKSIFNLGTIITNVTESIKAFAQKAIDTIFDNIPGMHSLVQFINDLLAGVSNFITKLEELNPFGDGALGSSAGKKLTIENLGKVVAAGLGNDSQLTEARVTEAVKAYAALPASASDADRWNAMTKALEGSGLSGEKLTNTLGVMNTLLGKLNAQGAGPTGEVTFGPEAIKALKDLVEKDNVGSNDISATAAKLATVAKK